MSSVKSANHNGCFCANSLRLVSFRAYTTVVVVVAPAALVAVLCLDTQSIICEISGSHCGEYEDESILAYSAV
jgi:hypothetical protein